MKLHTLGTGGPRLDGARGSACHVLEAAGRHLMFDVGRGAIRGVGAKGRPIASIGPLFISHHHVDHIGELANYLITSWIEQTTPEALAEIEADVRRDYVGPVALSSDLDAFEF